MTIKNELQRFLGVAERKTIISEAFHKIFTDDASGVLRWDKISTGEPELHKATTEVVVQNIMGEQITIPVMLYARENCDPGCDCCPGTETRAFLQLVPMFGPCRNNFDERVKRLTEKVFSIRVGWHNLLV